MDNGAAADKLDAIKEDLFNVSIDEDSEALGEMLEKRFKQNFGNLKDVLTKFITDTNKQKLDEIQEMKVDLVDE